MLSSTWSEDLETEDPYLRSIVDSPCGQRASASIADVTPSVAGTDRSARVAARLESHPARHRAIVDDRTRIDYLGRLRRNTR